MKEILISILRDRTTGQLQFRDAVERLASILAVDVSQFIPKEKSSIETPVGASKGFQFKHPIALIPILRSGVALLPTFMRYYPAAEVGFIGIYREEATALPHHYYHKLPKLSKSHRVIILEPMLATGGSLSVCIQLLKSQGVPEENIIIANIISAPEGIEVIMQAYPKIKLVTTQKDEKLNDQKFIVPGLGDFGDRFFGTL